MRFSRRESLGLLAGLSTLPLLSPRRASAAQPEFREPPLAATRRPEPGLVEVEIEARPARIGLAGRPTSLWTYGSSIPGRTIRAREGETLRLRFTNRLPEATNLHFHGLHIPPTGRADNIWLEIPPGERFDYEFTIPKGEAGTYWYHPHLHGSIARQLWAGLAGALVLESPLDAMPELAAAEDRIVVLKDFALTGGQPAAHRALDWIMGKEGDLILVNGLRHPVLRAKAASLRLRLINASNARYFNVALEGGRPLHLIATDGHFLERPVALESVLLPPAARADVLVRFADETPLRLIDLPYDRRAGRFRRVLQLIDLLPPPRPALLPLPDRLATLLAYRPEDAVVERRIDMGVFYLNGQPFNPRRVDTRGAWIRAAGGATWSFGR